MEKVIHPTMFYRDPCVLKPAEDATYFPPTTAKGRVGCAEPNPIRVDYFTVI